MAAHRTVTILGEAPAVLSALDHGGDTTDRIEVAGWILTSLDRADTELSILAQQEHAAPGLPSAEVLFASDLIVIALSAATGLSNAWHDLWQMVEAYQRPCIVVVTDLDQARADIDEMTAIARRIFEIDDAIHVTSLPALDDDDTVAGTVDLIDLMVHDASVDPPQSRAADPEHIALLAERRLDLAFTLAARHVEGELAAAVHAGLTPDARSLAAAVVSCTADARFFPVLPLGAGPRYVGGEQLATLIAQVAAHTPARLPVISAVPPRTSVPQAPTANDAPCAQVILGDEARSVARLWSGTLDAQNEPGGLLVLATPQPIGTVIADPPDSLVVTLPAN